MRVQHNALAVVSLLIVLKSTSVEADLFTALSDALLVEMSEHVELEETLSDVWLGHEVDLEQLRLERTFVGQVALESFEEECCGLSNTRVLEEDLEYAFNRCLRVALSIPGSNHLCKIACGLRVQRHH